MRPCVPILTSKRHVNAPCVLEHCVVKFSAANGHAFKRADEKSVLSRCIMTPLIPKSCMQTPKKILSRVLFTLLGKMVAS